MYNRQIMTNYLFTYRLSVINTDTFTLPDFTTPEVMASIAATITAFMVYKTLRYKHKLRTVYIFVQRLPKHNWECPEVRYTWFFDNFHVIVVEINTNNILGEYYLTSELTNVFTEIEKIHNRIVLITNQLNWDYYEAEQILQAENNMSSLSFPGYFDPSIRLLNRDTRNISS